MKNPYLEAAKALQSDYAPVLSLLAASSISTAITLLEQAGRELQRDSLHAEIEAFDPIAAQLDDERESAYGMDR